MRRALALWGVLTLGCAGVLSHDPLQDLHPFVWPAAGEVRLFTCRWPRGATLGVSLDGGDSPEQQRALAAALVAWQDAGIGIRFRSAPAGKAQVHVHLVAGPLERAGGRAAAGRTEADCAIPDGDPTRAHLVSASVAVSTVVGPDWRDHTRAASPAELAGTLLHELGHALGFAGHPAADDPMVLESDANRRFGRRILAGQPVRSPALSALYALPSGTVLAESAVARWRTAPVDRLLALAQAKGLEGPFAQSGDAAAAVFWREPSGGRVEVLIPDLAGVRRDPGRVLPVPGPGARALLGALTPGPTGPAPAPAPRAAPPRPNPPSP